MELRIECPPSHRGSQITLCGEAPGQDEVWCKQGFVGEAGRVLRKMCAAGGLDLDECNLTNVVKRRPPGNDFAQAFYTKERVGRSNMVRPTDELKAWYEALRLELIEHRPNVVVALGNEALKALTGLTGVSKRQGSVYESILVPGLKVVAMQHPAALLHAQNWQDLFVGGHILREIVVPESKFPELRPTSWTEFIAPRLTTIEERFAEAARAGVPWVIDIEVRGKGIACVGVGFDWRGLDRPIEVLVVPIETSTGPYFELSEEGHFWLLLQQLADDNPHLMLQNAGYDLDWLFDYGFLPQSVELDLMLGHHLLHPELPKSLEFLNFFYATGIPYYKDSGKTWGKRWSNDLLYEYNAKDVACELIVGAKIKEALRLEGLEEEYGKWVAAAMPIALEMQWRGFRINDERLAETRQLLLQEWQRTEAELHALAGHPLNVGSPSQVCDFLYSELGFPVMYGRRSSDEDALVTLKTWLSGQPPTAHTAKCEFGAKPCKHLTAERLARMQIGLELVMKQRKLSKNLSSYLDDKLYDTDTLFVDADLDRNV